MSKVNDILLDENLDIIFENGDIKTGPSTNQHQKLLLISEKGQWRMHPFVGVGLLSAINDDEQGSLNAEIRKQFELDGMFCKHIKIDAEGKLNIEAEYL